MSEQNDFGKIKLFFSDGDREAVTKIKVMADYGASVWDHDGAAFNLTDIGVPSELESKFTAWHDWYGMNLYDADNFDVTAFDKQGLDLARELKRFVGNDVRVTFFAETTGQEVEIEG